MKSPVRLSCQNEGNDSQTNGRTHGNAERLLNIRPTKMAVHRREKAFNKLKNQKNRACCIEEHG
jgi:hypothetical protein